MRTKKLNLNKEIRKKYGEHILEHTKIGWEKEKIYFISKMFPEDIIEALMIARPLPLTNMMEADVLKSVFLYGESGNGKSVRSARMMLRYHKFWYYTRIWEDDLCISLQSPTYAFVKVPKLFRELKEAIHEKRNPYSIIKAIENVEYLVLDDIGSERSTDYTYDILYDLIDTRTESRKSTITLFTSNPQLKELPYDDRLKRRIKDICQGEMMRMPHYSKLK